MTVHEHVPGHLSEVSLMGRIIAVKVSEIKINEENRRLIRPLTSPEFEHLEYYILKNGVRVPIDLNEKLEVLDGHHRAEISIKLGLYEIPARIHNFNGDRNAERAFVYDVNVPGRRLNDLEVAKLSYELVSNDTNYGDGRVRDLVAKETGLSPATCSRAINVIENGSPDLNNLVSSGRMSISMADKAIRKQKRVEQLLLQKPAIKLPEGCKLVLGDSREKGDEIPDNSIDLIFTDPPYAIEYLYLYEWLGKFAYRVLKPDPSLITYLGQYAILQEGNAVESSGLRCIWTHAVLHTGHNSSQPAPQVFVTWKPLLEFVKGGDRMRSPDFMRDSVVVSKPPNKDLDEWAQSPVEAEHYISKRTLEGDIIVDPFMGSGTAGIAALKLKRKFYGIEIDPIDFERADANIKTFMESLKDK